MTKKVQEHIRFDCLLTETQLYSLILLEWNIFLRKYQKKKSEINLSHTIYLEYKIMILLCVDFIVLLS